MPAKRQSQRVKANPTKRSNAQRPIQSYGFEPYPKREIRSNRTVTYIESDSDSGEEVIYVGQRKKTRTPPASTLAPALSQHRKQSTPQRPVVTLGEEDLSVSEQLLWKKQQEAPVEAVVQKTIEQQETIQQPTTEADYIPHGRPLFQTLPFEVCLLSTNTLSSQVITSNQSFPTPAPRQGPHS
jgi:hypothetical protein